MPGPQRMPAREKTIGEIGADDVRISIVGTVVDSSGSVLAVDDGSGKINASFEEPPGAGPGQMVRVTGRVMPVEGGFELQGEACLGFSGDIETWRRVSGLWHESLKHA